MRNMGGLVYMRHQNINITGTGIYHPKHRVGNQYFIDHFKKMGKDVSGLLKHLEREYRYLSDDPGETVVTMGCHACREALKDANVSMEEMDLLVFATDTPEYTSPTNAIKLLDMLGGATIQMAYDTNSNCLGMVTALDQASRILMTNQRFHKALVVGSMLFSSVSSRNDEVSYSNFGDAAAAVVLEKAEEEEGKRGFLDSVHFTQTSECNCIRMPKAGFSRIIRDGVEHDEDKKWYWEPFDGSFISDIWERLIRELTEDNHLKPSDLGHLIFSQFTMPDARRTLDKLNISYDRTTYVGKEYGYTGTTSPVLALDRALKMGKIHRKDYVTICSMGSGTTVSVLLFQF